MNPTAPKPATRPRSDAADATTPSPDAPASSGRWAQVKRGFLAFRARVETHRVGRVFYRVGVTIVGFALIVLAGLTGWLPGPGGIPLALLGLAVLATEYAWARRLLVWARDQVKRFGHWAGRFPAWVRALGVVALILVVLAGAWGLLVLVGVPNSWPNGIEHLLAHLPGVH